MSWEIFPVQLCLWSLVDHLEVCSSNVIISAFFLRIFSSSVFLSSTVQLHSFYLQSGSTFSISAFKHVCLWANPPSVFLHGLSIFCFQPSGCLPLVFRRHEIHENYRMESLRARCNETMYIKWCIFR
jgi:hypothetical protein